MLLMTLRLFGRTLEKWKWITDRKFRGVWLGSPPVLLSYDQLLAGDVLFCGDKSDRKKAHLIRTASAGGYVHCALYTGAGLVVDIVPGGMRSLNLDNFLQHYSYVAVARCPGNAENLRRKRRLSVYAAKALQGRIKGYSYLGAALAPLKELFDLQNLDRLWQRSKRTTPSVPHSKRMFCSEFIIEAYIDCGYIHRNDPYLEPVRRTPTGLAEENIFSLVGFVSMDGWEGISADDHFLGGCGWVLSEQGRERLRIAEQEMQKAIDSLSEKENSLL